MNIQLFNNPHFGDVRITGTPDSPLFCLADICRAVELTNPSSVKSRLEPEDVQLIDLHALNGGQEIVGNSMATFINESAAYEVILFSNSPKVRPFRRWLTKEVIPTIRKTGAYATTEVLERAMNDPDYAIRVFQQIKDLRQKNQMLEGKNALLEQENQELAPKAQYADDVLQSNGTYTHTEMAKELNFRSWNAFIDACKKDGILFKHQGGMYMLYSKYAGKGYMKTRTNTFTHKDGSIGTSVISVWTEAGRHFLHEHFNVALQPVDFTMFNLEKDL